MASDGESLALADCIELRPFVPACHCPPWVELEPCLLDMVSAGAVGFSFELDIAVVDRGGKFFQFCVCQRHRRRAPAKAAFRRLSASVPVCESPGQQFIVTYIFA